MKKLSKNTLIYGLGSALNKSISIFLLPLLTRYLSPSDYGVIGILLMFSMFFSNIISLGFGTSIGIVYFEKTNDDERIEIIRISFWILLMIGGFLGVVFLSYVKKLSILILGDDKYWVVTSIVVIATVISTVVMPLILNIQFLEKATQFVVSNLVISVFSIIINIILVVFAKRGLQGYFEAYLLTQLLTFVIFSINTKFNLRFAFNKEIAKKLLKYGIPMVPSFFSLFIISQSNRYILRYFSGLESVGIYTVGYNIGSTTQIIVNAFQNAWTPYFFSFYNKQKEAYIHFGQILKFFLIIMGLICLCFFVFSKAVVIIFLSRQFLESYKVIGFVALSNLFLGVYALLLPPMYFEKEVKYTSLIQGITAILSIFINFLLIQYFGEFGASIGFCMGYFFMAYLTWLFNEHKSKSILKNYKIDPNIGKILLSFFVFILLSYYPRNFDLIVELLFSIFLYGMLIFVVYWFLDKNDKDKLKNFFINFGFVRS